MAKAGSLSTGAYWSHSSHTPYEADESGCYRTGTLRCTQTLFTIPSPNMIISANEPL